mmetsp:Transcript_33627/g.83850  ORF Transcript_33627/g.83850 Transcript_33627/m.83850 type:complete len:88 (-) Transcript_33627:217-480(-)
MEPPRSRELPHEDTAARRAPFGMRKGIHFFLACGPRLGRRVRQHETQTRPRSSLSTCDARETATGVLAAGGAAAAGPSNAMQRIHVG